MPTAETEKQGKRLAGHIFHAIYYNKMRNTSYEFKLQSFRRQERRLGKWNQNMLKTQSEYPYSKIAIEYIITSTQELSVLSHPP